MAHAVGLDQQPKDIQQYDCCCCDFKENKQAIMQASIFGASSAFGAGATWLVSSVTSSLTGGILGAVSTGIALLALGIFEKMGLKDGEQIIAAIATMVVLNGAAALIATSIGFSVSLPLSLLYTASTVAAFVATIMALQD